MWFILAIALSLFVTWLIVEPGLATAVARTGRVDTDNEIQTLLDKKARCVSMIKDLELDYETGKVSLEDFNEAKQRATAELAKVLERMEK